MVWSMDVIIGFTIFMAAIAAFFVFTAIQYREGTPAKLLEENRIIINALENSPELAAINLGELDEGRVQELEALPYDALKAKLGLTKDFCIVFQDAAGNVIEIAGIRSLGDPRLTYSYEGATYTCGRVPPPPAPPPIPPPLPPPPPPGPLYSCSAKASCGAGEACAYQLSSGGHVRDCAASDPFYPMKICCGSALPGCTISCVTQGTPCGAGSAEMVELSAPSNAHLQDPALAPDYAQHVCCTATGACQGKSVQQCTVAATCAAGSICVGSLTGPTNADGAACGTYAASLCCPV
jgi:hypothetical protein